ncbi:MAG: hypothetical protein IPF98_22610 [Gemmatimonadetes bacterium]|nr:hypothetical protein [Gemmatimonadota bacterium]
MSATTSRPRIAAIVLPTRPAQPLATMQASAAALPTIAAICATASATAGFSAIETLQVSATTLRIVAHNDSQQALVTEVTISPDGEAAMVTEVVGVHDGSCTAILDAFDRAVEAGGVRSLPPRRKHTGGACDLAASRELLQRFTRRLIPAKASPRPQAPASRTRTASSRNRNRGSQ